MTAPPAASPAAGPSPLPGLEQTPAPPPWCCAASPAGAGRLGGLPATGTSTAGRATKLKRCGSRTLPALVNRSSDEGCAAAGGGPGGPWRRDGVARLLHSVCVSVSGVFVWGVRARVCVCAPVPLSFSLSSTPPPQPLAPSLALGLCLSLSQGRSEIPRLVMRRLRRQHNAGANK